MKSVVQAAMQTVGIYYAKRRYMPSGVDWLWDIERLLDKRDLGTALDVGANVGHTTRAIKKRFPRSSVHAIEPVADTYALLRRSCREMPGVHTHSIAVSDERGRGWMATGENSELNYLTEAPDASLNGEQVDTDTLDHFCAQHGIGRVGLLKLDTEGAELKVLRGARDLIDQRRVAFLFCEVGFKAGDRRHVHVSELLNVLPGAGFQTYAFYDYYHEAGGRDLVFANLLSVCPEALDALL